MRQITQFVLSSLGIAFSTRWLDLMTPTETPSRRYVRRSRTQPTQSTSGLEGLKASKSMGRILDPDWSQFKYVPAAKTDLKESMERYKRMVSGADKKLHNDPKARDGGGHHGQVSSKQDNCLQSPKLAVVRGKA